MDTYFLLSPYHSPHAFFKQIAAALEKAEIDIPADTKAKLSACFAPSVGVIALANAIKDMRARTSLNLASNLIGSEGAKHVAEAIKVSVLLRLVWYQFHAHRLNGSTAVVCHYPQDMGAISSVNILFNGIGTKQAQVLANILKEHATLKSLCGNMGDEMELDMSGKPNKRLDAGGAIMLAPEIAKNGALTKLDISENNIGAEQEGGLQRICVAGGIELAK